MNKGSKKYPEIKNMVIESYNLINWFKADTFNTSQSAIVQIAFDIQKYLKFNAFLFLNHMYHDDLPPIYTQENMVKIFEARIVQTFKLNVNSSFHQAISQSLFSLLVSPEKFAAILLDYSAKEQNYIRFISLVSLPSLYSFYIISDTVDYAVKLAKLLLYDDTTDLGDIFASSFFIHDAKFIDTLWGTFAQNYRRIGHVAPPFVAYRLFLESLRQAISYLSPYHFNLATYVISLNLAKFVHIIMDMVFIPTLKFRIAADHTLRFQDNCQSLLNDFDFVINNQQSPPLIHLVNIFKHAQASEITLPTFGDYGLSKYSIPISPFELAIFSDIVQFSPDPISNTLKLVDKSREDLRVGIFDVFCKKSATKNTIISDHLFHVHREAIFKREKDQFVRSLKQIQIKFDGEGIDIMHFIEPSLVKLPFEKQKLEKMESIYPILGNDEFRTYAAMKIFNVYQHNIGLLNKSLDIKIHIKMLESSLEILKKTYDLFLNTFSTIPNLENYSKIATRASINKIQALTEDEINPIIKTFQENLLKCQNATPELRNILESHMYERELVSIQSEARQISSMNVLDRIYSFPIIMDLITTILKIYGIKENEYCFHYYFCFCMLHSIPHECYLPFYEAYAIYTRSATQISSLENTDDNIGKGVVNSWKNAKSAFEAILFNDPLASLEAL